MRYNRFPKTKTGSLKHFGAVYPVDIKQLLDEGKILAGPGSDQHDTFFYRDGEKYVYCLVMEQYQPPRHYYNFQLDEFEDMLTFALFHDSWYFEREKKKASEQKENHSL